MNAVSSIAVTVLLLQIGAITAQICSTPSCRGSSGGPLLDLGNCRCSGSLTDSTCPAGTTPAQNDHGLCSCEATTQPQCKKGFSLDSRNCRCNIRQLASCPAGSSLSPTAYCTGSHTPTCRTGSLHNGCQCVKEYIRQCPAGETLSKNGCKCSKPTQSPTCSNNCRLNSRSCTCESAGVTCYYGTSCSGGGFVVPSVQDCCRGIFLQDSLLSSGYSHRSADGYRCISCSRPH